MKRTTLAIVLLLLPTGAGVRQASQSLDESNQLEVARGVTFGFR